MGFFNFIKAAGLAAAVALPGAALAEWQPSGPVTIQIGFGAGGSTDTLGRAIAATMEEQTGWDVIVENKPGGGGVAMFSSLVRAKPDGLKMGIGVTTPTLMNLAKRGDTLPFKVDSFDYLATIVLAPLAVVAHKDAPYNTIAELIEYSKTQGSALIGFDGGPQRLLMLALNNENGSKFEMVSNKSGAEIMQGLLGGQLDAGFGAGAHIQYVNSGDLKLLGVVTGDRHGYAPDTPTFIEQGYNHSIEGYWYIAAPKGLEADAKAAVAGALDAAITSEALTELIGNLMKTTPDNRGPEGAEQALTGGLDAIEALIAASEG